MNRSCLIPNCFFKHKARGYCNKHYRRLRSQGDPNKILISHDMNPGESSFNALYYIYIKNAEKRNIKFELTKDQFKKLTKEDCFYCLLPPNKKIKYKQYKGEYIYNGVDRIDSNKDYTQNNCVTCCTTCNMMKTNMNALNFLTHIQMIQSNDSENFLYGKLMEKTNA